MSKVLEGTTGSHPALQYELDVDQLSGSGNKRTIKLTLWLKVYGSSSSWYGYPVEWQGLINGTWSSKMKVKGNESWNGGQSWRKYTWTLTTDVGTTSSKNIEVGFTTNSYGGSDGWDATKKGTFTVGSTNTNPVCSGATVTSPSGIIPENTSSIVITPPLATDVNGNLSGYRIQCQINDGNWNTIYSGSSRSFTHNISNYGQGTKFRYRADSHDSEGLNSDGWCFSDYVYKNSFTPDTITACNNINFDTTVCKFSYSGASNTNGNGSFTRVLSCDNVPVYNQSNISDGIINLKIWKSGALPTEPYIKFDELKAYLKKTGYCGNLTFRLKTTNAYNSSGSNSANISCDIRTNPNPPTNCKVNFDKSSCYREVASTKNKYFLPDGTRNINISWDAGSDKLGDTVTYSVYYKLGSNNYVLLASGLTGLEYNHVLNRQNNSQLLSYKIVVNTNYGYSSEALSNSIVIHYYNTPSLTVGNINRTETEVTVPVIVKTNSSIPNINTVGSWVLDKFNGKLTQQQTQQIIDIKGLIGNTSYSLVITYNDDTGFSSNQSTSIKIPTNAPVFFINKYGVGVGGTKAINGVPLNVVGKILVNNNEVFHRGNLNPSTIGAVSKSELGQYSFSNRDLRVYGKRVAVGFDTPDGNYLALNYNNDFANGVQIFGNLKTTGNILSIGGEKAISMGCGGSDVFIVNSKSNKFLQLKDDGRLTYDNKKIYHEGNKPTLKELGLDYVLNKNLNGYFKTDNNLIMQWGFTSVSNGKTINLPIALNNADYNIQLTVYGGPTGVTPVKCYGQTSTSFRLEAEKTGYNVFWLAIGWIK